ncbi:hypothetical protein [Jatrophihabitans fulvus]
MSHPSAPRRDSARLVSAAIGVVALVIALIVAGTADDTGSPAATPNGAPVPGGTALPGAGGAAGDGSGSSGRGSGGSGRCDGRDVPEVLGAVNSGSALVARFPLPNGAVKRVDGPGTLSGSRGLTWTAPGTLTSVDRFYAATLPTLGVVCFRSGLSVTNPRFAQWLYSIERAGTRTQLGNLSVTSGQSLFWKRPTPAGEIVIDLTVPESSG